MNQDTPGIGSTVAWSQFFQHLMAGCLASLSPPISFRHLPWLWHRVRGFVRQSSECHTLSPLWRRVFYVRVGRRNLAHAGQANDERRRKRGCLQLHGKRLGASSHVVLLHHICSSAGLVFFLEYVYHVRSPEYQSGNFSSCFISVTVLHEQRYAVSADTIRRTEYEFGSGYIEYTVMSR